MGYVLFSPIGNTDPIRGFRDGAWLHICRVYRPRVCVVYLSALMCRRENVIESDGQKKDLYARTLALLNEKLYGDEREKYIKLEFVRDPDCEDAHSLEYFMPKYQAILSGLREKYPDDELLINVSSGTAGMKNAVIALSVMLPFKVAAVQVSDPTKGATEKPPIVDESYPVEEAWICDEDNDDAAFVNRASMQPMANLTLGLRLKELRRLIQEGDYHTAFMEITGDGLKAHIQPGSKAYAAIRGAEQRGCMNTERAVKALKTAGFHMDRLYGLRADDRVWQCAEYLLTMRNDIKTGAFDNFMRKLTPLLVNLCELYLLKIGQDVRKNGVNAKNKWVRSNMPEEWQTVLDAAFYTVFKDGSDLSAANLLPLIKKYGSPDADDLASRLRSVEERVRNLVAHNIVPFGRAEVERELQSVRWARIDTPEQLADCLRAFMEMIEPFAPGYWDSYDAMNACVCGLLGD